MLNFFRELHEFYLVFLLSAFGGFIRILNRQDPLTPFMFFAGITTAIFTGMLTHFILLEYGVSENLRAVAISLSGFTSRDLLQICASKFLEKARQI